jgi:hypothetical protein
MAVVTVALGLVAVGGTAGQADTSTCAGVATLSIDVAGKAQIVTSAQLCAVADVFNTTYQTRGSPGAANTQDTPQVQQGTSIRALLGSIGVDPDTVQFVDIPRTDGTWTTLSGDDLAATPDFAQGLPPVFVVNGDHIDYYRPLYADPNDTNAADHVQSPADGQLAVGVHTGPLLSVTASASADEITAGATVTFTATVSGSAASSLPYRYSWVFGDGSIGTGRTVRHRFVSAGSFEAQATVAGSDSSGGVSPQVQITVGTPPTGGTGPGGGAVHHPHHPASGPAKSHGHATGASPSNRNPPASAAPTGNGGHPAAPSRHTTRAVITTGKARRDLPALADVPPTVTGRVVSPGMTLTANQVTSAAATSSPAARLGGSDLRVGSGVVAAAGVLALLGLGMARELRGSRRRSGRAS